MQDIQIRLPEWLDSFLATRKTRLDSDEARMRLALDLVGESLRRGAGGPFGAALFEEDTGELVAAGMNLVVASHCSIAHAEMVAIASAQQGLGHYDLGQALPGGAVLYTTAEPCAMCLGAITWSGIGRVVCGARDEDVRAIGFDEGHKPWDWIEGYALRGIQVTRDLLREDAAELLKRYAEGGGERYGPTRTVAE